MNIPVSLYIVKMVVGLFVGQVYCRVVWTNQHFTVLVPVKARSRWDLNGSNGSKLLGGSVGWLYSVNLPYKNETKGNNW